MSEEGLKKTGEMLRSICQPQFPVTEEQIIGVRNGEFPDDRTLKCYSNCLSEIVQLIKKGKLQYAASLKSIETLLPDDLKPPFRHALEMCRNAADGIEDYCEAAYALTKCNYKNNPKFMFP